MSRSILILLFALVSGSVWAVPQGPVIGKVTLILGSVTAVDQDGDSVELKRGADLYAGFSLDTGSRSLIRAEMNDGTRFTLSQNSSASLDDFSFDEATATGGFDTTVRQGGFQYVSGRLGAGLKSRVHSRISTPSGVIGVRGTTIEGEHGPNGLVINITTGTVEVTYSPPSGPPQTQVVGEDGETQIASVTIDGVATPLNEVPESLQSMVNTLVQMVVEAEAEAGDGSGDSADDEEDAEEEEEEGEQAEEDGDTDDAEETGDDESGDGDSGDENGDDSSSDQAGDESGDSQSNLNQGDDQQQGEAGQQQQQQVPAPTNQTNTPAASGGGTTEEELDDIMNDVDDPNASTSTQT